MDRNGQRGQPSDAVVFAGGGNFHGLLVGGQDICSLLATVSVRELSKKNATTDILVVPGLLNRPGELKIDGIKVIVWAAHHNANAVWDAGREIAELF